MNRTTVTTKKGRKILIEDFRNINELIHVTDSRELTDWAEKEGSTRERTDNKWAGASYKEARNLLQFGWDEHVKEFDRSIKNLEKQQIVNRTSFKNDVIGFAPIVPNAIIGIPQSMINNVQKPKKSKVIKVMIDIGTSHKVSSNKIKEFGAKLLQKLYSLEKSGFRVRIDFLKAFNGDGYENKSYILRFPLKNENQPFDLKRMSFPIVHTAMLRRITFDWYERLPDSKYLHGYGYSLSFLKEDEKLKFEDIKKEIVNEKDSYLVLYGDNLDEVFKGVR